MASYATNHLPSKAREGNNHESLYRSGRITPGYDRLPRAFVRFQMQDLSEAELKVMLYIFDHTWGYLDERGCPKTADAISRSQFLYGIRRADSTVVDRGAGISERSLDRALKSLVAGGFILRHRHIDAGIPTSANIYELNLDGQPGWCLDCHNSQPLSIEAAGQAEVKTSADSLRAPNMPACICGETGYLEEKKGNFTDQEDSSRPGQGEAKPANPGTVPGAKVTASRKVPPSSPADLPLSPPVNLPETITNQQKRIYNNPQTHHTGKGCGWVLPPENSTGLNTTQWGCSGQVEHGSGIKPEVKGSLTKHRSLLEKEEVEKLSQELLEAHIARSEAVKLARVALANGHRPGYVTQALAYIDQQESVRSREGFLIHLVRSNWLPHPAVANESRDNRTGSWLGTGSKVAAATTQQDYLPDSTVPLPSLANTSPALLPKLIEMEEDNLLHAYSERDRLVSTLRLERFRQMKAQLEEAALASNASGSSSRDGNSKSSTASCGSAQFQSDRGSL
ncbi:MAG TPA: hypothetical protein VH186_39220 [Chloroflexia bacterium]|nr:hypothetical protein [Chloroflexia bacterium]